MKLSYKHSGEYKGQFFKIESAKVCKADECGYGAVVEINGVKRHTHIGTRKNIFDTVEAAAEVAKRFIDSSLQQTLAS